MENFDPLGIHTGESIVVAPTCSLSDDQVKMLQTLMNFCMNDAAVEEIKAASDPDAVFAVIEKYFA